ncbi:M4 family metallopeptidase [Flavobacterium sp. M31R6]|uniref:M4 family metallopeptidase n=1 Tax=Flavobacterium sp. M31R6 TaxID=2739062 RepID=UPI001568DBE3|nr:M4 family metallopeptidase [Flavobacterium sp. M31R6]QKJ62049.1 M4 family metallopeptidase [Flavobacterium sp. M31R6]
MKNTLLKKGICLIIFSFSTLTLFSQEGDKNVLKKITNEKGIPTLITFTSKSTYKISDYQQLFKDQLGLKGNSNFTKIKSEIDKLGVSHEKFQLFHNGIKVEFSTYTLHSAAGKLSSMNGEFYKTDLLNAIPTLSQDQAFAKALQQIGAQTYLWEIPEDAKMFNYKKPIGELVWLPILDGDNSNTKDTPLRLAYKFDIYATKPVSRGDIYIDAITGETLFYNATIKHLGEYSHGKAETNSGNQNKMVVPANADTRYSGSQTIQTTLSGANYILADATRGNGINTFNMKKGTNYSNAVNFTDADNNWTTAEYNNANKDNGAFDAHWGAEKTYDYWSTVHGRNSYDNAGAVIKSYVHYDNAYDNAFWDGSVMTYGDGSGTNFDILTALDVAGHEIGHAVCEKTANLAYQKESGAMNEALSDIWGACIEYFAAPTKSTWLIGEDIERRSGHLSLRSMSNPKAEGQPDTYGGTNWKNPNCGFPFSYNDYCGVHTNSGVLNHWFYILSVGKSGTNDKGKSYSVTGITIEKAAKITFRLESVYLTANSTYANARTYGIQSATDLYGAGSAEVIATTNAFYAVGVGDAYAGPTDTTAPSAPTDLTASGTTDTTTNLSWTAATDNVAVTGYNVYNGASLITTVTGTTYNVTGLTASTAYTFTVKAKDAAGNLSAVSNDASITTLPTPADTTVPTAPTNLTASGTTDIATNLSWTASTDNVAVTGYNVYNGATLITTVTGTSYSVTGLSPSTAYTFTVRAKDAATNLSDPSNEVNITTLATDTTPPTAPTALTASGTTSTTTNLSWTAATDNVAVTGYNVYNGATLVNTVTGTSYTVTGLSPSTDYTFTIKAKDAKDNLSPASNAVSVTTAANNITYCASKGTSVAYEYIDYVGIGGIANTTTGNGGYGNFTNLTGNLPYGSNTIVLSIGYKSYKYKDYWGVWIDFNQNGTFENSEKVVSTSTNSATNNSYSFSVPASALTGATRMRVSLKRASASTACESFYYGEVEDYTVNIGASTIFAFANPIANTSESITNTDPYYIFPNPTSSILNITNPENKGFTYRIITSSGIQIATGKTVENSINTNYLSPGVYILELNDGTQKFTKTFIKK